MDKQPSKKQKTEEEPKTTILTTETGEYDLTNILALAFGGGTTD
jgi:hypothetical protein